MYERHFPSILTLGPRNGLGYYVVTTVYKLKNENFYVHPNNKVPIITIIISDNNNNNNNNNNNCTNPQKGAQCMNRMIDLSD